MNILNSKTLSNKLDKKIMDFAICSSGIYLFYLLYGLLQEKIFTTNYPLKDLSDPFKFKESSLLVLFQVLLSFLLAKVLNTFRHPKHKNEISNLFAIKLGVFNTISMIGSISALNFVSYPVQALMKSSKILSVMLVTLVIGGKKHSALEYLCASFITFGIFIFNLLGNSKILEVNERNSSLFGLVLLTISLLSDGMLAEYQRKVKESLINFTTYDLMEATSKFSALFCLVYSILSQEIMLICKIPSLNYQFLIEFSLICCLGAFGQLFIFYTIISFGPIVLSVITTTRKFFTVLFSILIFSHTINFFQWVSVLFVFTGVGIEMVYNIKLKKDHSKKINV